MSVYAETTIAANGPRARLGMSADQRAAHERLAALPSVRRVTEHRSRSDMAREKADTIRSATLLGAGYQRGPAATVAAPSETYRTFKSAIDAASKRRRRGGKA